MTNVRQRIYSLDWLRAIAIVLVLFLHASHTFHDTPVSLKWLVSSGWAGVDLFFVLSGFLIGRQAFKAQESGKSKWKELSLFWTKRWFRTVPLYFAVLFLYVYIKPLFGQPFKQWNWGFLVFLQNYTGIFDMDHTWSLSIEEQFYFIFPLLLFFTPLGKLRKLWILPLFISVLYRFLVWKEYGFVDLTISEAARSIHFLTHTHMDGIACGLFLAATYDTWKNYGNRLKQVLVFLGLAVSIPTMLLTGVKLHGIGTLLTFPLLSIGYSALIVGTYGWGSDGRLFRCVQKIALWSYGLYLWNTPILGFLKRLDGKFHWSVNWLIFFLISLLVSAITYYLIEEVFLKLRNKVLRLIDKQKVP